MTTVITNMMSVKEAAAYQEGYRKGRDEAFEICLGVAAGLQTEYGENVVLAIYDAMREEQHE